MDSPGGVLATSDGETAFFRAVIRYRPRGSHRHFAVIGMCRELERELNTSISSEDVWSLLRTCYNLDFLNERVSISNTFLNLLCFSLLSGTTTLPV